MLTAIVKKGDEVVASISAPDQARLDRAIANLGVEDAEVEQSGEPEPEGHDAPEDEPQ